MFDLANNTSRTLPSENGKNISILALTPDDSLLLSVDESGRSLLINFTNYSVLSHFNFGGAVRAVHFSPDGNLLAASKGRKVLVFQTPSRTKEFAPFRLLRTLGLHVDDIVSLDWSSDSQFLLTGSEDHTVRLQRPGHEFMPVILAAHRDTIVACMFGKTSEEIYTVARNGAVFVWRWHAKQSYRNNPETKFYLSSEGGIWRIAHRHFCHIQSTSLVEGLQHGEEEEALDSSVFVTCAAQMPKAGLLVVGLSNGVFRLCTMPEFSLVHSLSITQSRIDSIALNPSGEWIAFASSRLGQLLVWEWQSETYVLKQQGHYFDMRTTAYSPNGALMATGGDDCKVKVWNSRSGFCFCTFKDHTAPVTSVAFSKKGQVLLSASLDGTVRAYDLVRYRNFKVLAAPEPTQFSCVAIDASGEVVAAGSADSFGIFIWSLQTGRLLDILKGHEGPVSAVCFHPLTGKLASSSWDGSVRLWDIFGDLTAEQFKHSCEVLTCSFSHSGETICCATMDGSLNFWDVSEGRQISTIEGRRDIAGGRLIGQAMTSKNSAAGKHFTSVCFSADDSCVVAGGSTKYMCIYHVKHKVLIKRFQISRNLSLDGILDLLSTRNLTEGGPREQIEDDSRDDDHLPTLPGVKKGDLSSRRVPRAISCNELQFSPTGRSFCAATTEGLLIYSLDDDVLFDPFELDIEVTPENIKNTLTDKLYVKSLVVSWYVQL